MGRRFQAVISVAKPTRGTDNRARYRKETARRLHFSPDACMAEETILETQGLTKEFKGFVAVKDVDLSVRRGTIHALIGPNGAGKTTCFNLLTHFLTPTRGREEMREEVEARRFACAVRTDQRVDSPPPDRQIDVLDGHKALELLGQTLR